MSLRIDRPEPSTLRLEGEIDFASFEPLRAAMDSIFGAVRLEMAGIDFLDSSGLRVILDRLKSGPVTLVSPSPRIVRLIELCGVEGMDGLTIQPGDDG